MCQRGYAELRPEDVAQLQAAFGDNWPTLAGAYLGLNGEMLSSTVIDTLGLEGGRPANAAEMTGTDARRRCMPYLAVPGPAAQLDRTRHVLQGHLKRRL